jgi:hypothetical protein
MDSDRQQLAAVEQKIKELVRKQTRWQKKNQQRTITDEEVIELDGIGVLLEEAKDDKKYTESSSSSPSRNPQNQNHSLKPTVNGFKQSLESIPPIENGPIM